MGAGLSRGSAAGRWYGPPPTHQGRCASLRDRLRPLTRGPLPLPVLGREKLRCAASRPGLARAGPLPSSGTSVTGTGPAVALRRTGTLTRSFNGFPANGDSTLTLRAQAVVESNWVAFKNFITLNRMVLIKCLSLIHI